MMMLLMLCGLLVTEPVFVVVCRSDAALFAGRTGAGAGAGSANSWSGGDAVAGLLLVLLLLSSYD